MPPNAPSRRNRGVDRLEDLLAAAPEARATLRQISDEQQRFLETVGDHRTRRLLEVAERLADLEADRGELREALVAGETALSALQDIEKDLRAAKGWGTVDTLGGGMLSIMAKHSIMDAAQNKAFQAREKPRRLREELADLGRGLGLSLEVGDFLGFAGFSPSIIAAVASIIAGGGMRLVETEQSLEETRAARSAFIDKAWATIRLGRSAHQHNHCL